MQGTIDFSGTLSGSIAGGGGGGSTVTITPTLESGTKIADYTIDSENGELYAPDDVKDVLVRDSQSSVYQSVVDNEKNALIDLISYVKRNELIQELTTLEDEFDLKLTTKQNNLTAGANITIINDVISATGSSGGGINYSTSEQDTGLLWIDGKHIYQKTIVWNGAIGKNQSAILDSSIKFSDVSHFTIIEKEFSASATSSGVLFSNYYTNTIGGGNIEIAINDSNGIYMENYSNFYIRNAVLTIRYAKSV